MGSIERQSSIESEPPNLQEFNEPPTLTTVEMKRAREEALKILRSNSPEEALRIFTEGLKLKDDLVDGAKVKKVALAVSGREWKQPPKDQEALSPPNAVSVKDVASAPF
uniref:Uncharacterized protein n=1 Tax=Ananas comosus var. bracteatus TaxID=296719 RepID=A0A6V7P6H1_ANACO|nr:unnamed protein product [Ananas comosus var. bracteatus]